MKLIIDIDEKLACEGFERIFTEEERDILIRAIGNGTPYEERPQGGVNNVFADTGDTTLQYIKLG